MKKYTSSTDTFARYIPWLVALVFLAGAAKGIYDIRNEDKGVLIFTALFPAIILGIIFTSTWLFSVRGIAVDDDALMIERKINPVIIRFSDILSIKPVTDMRYAFRTFGNGGMFGYTGRYYKKGIGSMRWYCTQRRNYILIEKTNGKKILITPDEPEELMRDIEAKYPLLVVSINPEV